MDTTLDDKFLDWTNEEENEQTAIDDALREQGLEPAAKTKKRSTKKPSFKKQMDDGIIQYKINE